MENRKHPAINEKQRIKALYSYNILDTRSDNFLDNITELASQICNTPIALISLVDEKRQWIKSKVGIKATQTPREIAFCDQAILHNELYIVHDSLRHPLFKRNPLVTGEPKIRFYAGMPLTDPDGLNLGTLCVIDHIPKTLSRLQKSALSILSKSVINYLSLRKNKVELSQVAADLHNLFLNSPDLICTATPDGYFKKINSAFKTELGYTENELLNEPFIKMIHPDDLDATYRVLGQLNKKGARVQFFRNRYRCKDGNYLWLSWNATYNHHNGLIIATARNISALIQMEEKINHLIEEEKKFNDEKILQLSELTSAVSHEMLNPLNMVLGFSGVSMELIDEVLSVKDEKVTANNLLQIKTDLLKIEEHAKHMANVVSNMSSINWNANPQANYNTITNENKISPKTFKINRVLGECIRLAYSKFKENSPGFNCEFNCIFDKNDPESVLSVSDFSKSVINILNNAFEAITIKKSDNKDFTPWVSVKTELANAEINIWISNNGIEIPQQNIKNLFNPFFTTKPNGKGMGLGLSISYNIIKMHHGFISVEKSDESETVFKISLPAGI